MLPYRGAGSGRGGTFTRGFSGRGRGRGGPDRGRGHERGRGGHGPPSLSKIHQTSHQEVPRAKEKSSRTLFVRNLAFEIASDQLEAMFKKYGEIRKMFDLVRTRGLLFITFDDIRHAEAALVALNETMVHNRKIEIHFAIPKEGDVEDDERNNASLLVQFTDQLAKNPSTSDIMHFFSQWGEVMEIRDEQMNVKAAEVAFQYIPAVQFMGSRMKVRWAPASKKGSLASASSASHRASAPPSSSSSSSSSSRPSSRDDSSKDDQRSYSHHSTRRESSSTSSSSYRTSSSSRDSHTNDDDRPSAGGPVRRRDTGFDQPPSNRLAMPHPPLQPPLQPPVLPQQQQQQRQQQLPQQFSALPSSSLPASIALPPLGQDQGLATFMQLPQAEQALIIQALGVAQAQQNQLNLPQDPNALLLTLLSQLPSQQVQQALPPLPPQQLAAQQQQQQQQQQQPQQTSFLTSVPNIVPLHQQPQQNFQLSQQVQPNYQLPPQQQVQPNYQLLPQQQQVQLPPQQQVLLPTPSQTAAFLAQPYEPAVPSVPATTTGSLRSRVDQHIISMLLTPDAQKPPEMPPPATISKVPMHKGPPFRR